MIEAPGADGRRPHVPIDPGWFEDEEKGGEKTSQGWIKMIQNDSKWLDCEIFPETHWGFEPLTVFDLLLSQTMFLCSGPVWEKHEFPTAADCVTPLC